MTDQVMVGQLGDIAIASVGISSKIFSVISVVLAGLAATLSIYTAQYWGKKDTKSISHLLGLSLYLGLSLSILFAIIVFFNPQPLLSLFTTDMLVTGEGGIFLQIGALSYVPIMLTMLYSAILRSTGHVKLPMYVSLCAVMLNIILNYLLIFGHFGFPQLGLAGAAYATVIARLAECLLIIGAVYWFRLPGAVEFKHLFRTSRPLARKFLVTMYPLVLTEFVWVLGEAVYAVIYSRMGVAEMTAMTITFPLQGLMIGLLSGIGAAAGVMVGNKLGEGDHTQAMNYARKLIRVGLVTSFGLGIVVVLLAPMYTRIFQVANMIIAGGILQSGGDSKFVFAMESTTTWLVGVPLGFMLSFVWKQPLFWVYFFLSLEEVVRFIIGYIRYRSGKWMQNLTVQSDAS